MANLDLKHGTSDSRIDDVRCDDTGLFSVNGRSKIIDKVCMVSFFGFMFSGEV